MNRLPDSFFTSPERAHTTMTRAELTATLLTTHGWIMAAGYSYDIKSKALGAGVYSVWLERRSGR